jgi:serine/threonine protein kinase
MQFQCPHCEGIVSISDTECGQPVGCGHCSGISIVPATRFSPSVVINDFLIKKVLGKGGMGMVYLAHQLSLDRPVALKILMQEFSQDNDFIVDFVKEARAAARLNHLNIVQSYAVGEEEGIYFFAMEYVEGKTLKQIMKEGGAIEIDRAVGIIQQIAEALDFAWKNQQLVHRDIKPDNIMLTNKGVAKLADLGLARKAAELMDNEDDVVMGTPQYISPEQLLGKPMDVRGDIYSLGATFFHAVTGRFPFEGASAGEIARKHLQAKLELPHKVNSSVPKPVSWIINKMMSKNPDDRYGDAAALAADLGRILRGELPDGAPAALGGSDGGKAGSKASPKSRNLQRGRPSTQAAPGAVAEVAAEEPELPAEEAPVEEKAPVKDLPGAAPETSEGASGGRRKLKKTRGKTKLKRGGTRAGTRATQAAAGSATTEAPAAATPAKSKSNGIIVKLVIALVVLVVLVGGGAGAFVFTMVKKYSPTSPEAVRSLYFAAHPGESSDFKRIERHLGEFQHEDPDDINEAIGFLDNYKKTHKDSLFVASADQVDDYALLFAAPGFLHGMVRGKLQAAAVPLAGSVIVAYSAYNELDALQLRKAAHTEEESTLKANRIEIAVNNALETYTGQIDDRLNTLVDILNGARDRFSEGIVEGQSVFVSAKGAVRSKAFEYGKAHNFQKFKDYVRAEEANIDAYPKRINRQINEVLAKTREANSILPDLLGSFRDEVDRIKIELDAKSIDLDPHTEKLTSTFEERLEQANLSSIKSGIENLQEEEDAVYETRSQWYKNWTDGIGYSLEYFELVAGTQTKLAQERIKVPSIKVDGLYRLEIANVTRTSILITVMQHSSETGDYRPVETLQIPISELNILEFMKLARRSFGEENALEDYHLRLGSFLLMQGVLKNARQYLSDSGGQGEFLLSELAAISMIMQMDVIRDISSCGKKRAHYDKLREYYQGEPALIELEPEFEKLMCD